MVNSKDVAEREIEIDETQHYKSDRVAKLIEERDLLLQTGVYTMNDPVISELDKEIRQHISNKTVTDHINENFV